MQSITAQLSASFRQAIQTALGVEADPLISVSQNPKFGDYQANAAMGLAKTLAQQTGQKTNPRQIAEQIIAKLELGEMAESVSIAGPGFINVKLSAGWMGQRLAQMLQSDRLGIDPVESPQKVVVDYSAPNIAKELHVGHLRSTIIGDALVRVLSFQGDEVIRQNHIGDWGTQFGMLIANLQDLSAQGTRIDLKDLESFYVQAKKRFEDDEDFQKRARQNVVKLQSGDPATLKDWQMLVHKTREHYQPIYQRLGVLLTPEDERGESFYNDMLAPVVADLKAAGLAEQSQGATAVFIDGPDKTPLIIEKSGGGYLYATTDLAALRYRTSTLHAQRVIYLVDARQSQHFQQVFATARKAGWIPAGVSLEHAAFGTMLGEDGRPFATRKGGTAKLKDLLDEAQQRAAAVVTNKSIDLSDEQKHQIAIAVGIGAVKYADLSKDRISDYVFSFDKMLSLDGNTAPYLQYAHARVRSIFRRAEERGIAYTPPSQIQLDSPHELALAQHLTRFGEVLELVSRELKPHHLCSYLYDLSTRFSGFFENCPVLQSDEPVRTSRLGLIDLTARTLSLGLDLLGIEHPPQM
ncbi:MAG: arginine--tRNA ligase [Phycisphaerales bacterium]|nr:arginine--tRNA ligase [Phycisphaerales bacterium]